jgi:hypothetical protein
LWGFNLEDVVISKSSVEAIVAAVGDVSVVEVVADMDDMTG